jgi:hypothetical protein
LVEKPVANSVNSGDSLVAARAVASGRNGPAEDPGPAGTVSSSPTVCAEPSSGS